MANANGSTAAQVPALKPLSFTDSHGANVTIPVDRVAFYATVKSDQLAVLNGLIADQAAGFPVELTGNVLSALASLASQLAHETNALVVALTQEPCAIPKDGA